MKKNVIIMMIALFAATVSFAQWQPQGDKIKTKWADIVNPDKVLPEYPRPIMERNDWKNLNGLWDYVILPIGEREPQNYDGKILVPFAIESSLSGVQKTLGSKNELWYRTNFTVPDGWKNKKIMLNFGAVDWKTEVFVNDIKIGTHTGGYTPFSFDVTPYLKPSGNQKLIVKVWDGTDEGYQPRGKQVKNPEGIWYTPVSGIWQTVWIEPVNNKYITHIKTIPDIDSKKLKVNVNTENTSVGDIIEVIMKDGNKIVASGKAAVGQALELSVSDMKLWSPDNPFLYNLEINLFEKEKVVDKVKSYAAMRKISTKRDKNGIVRFQLNNENIFPYGLLDQGWWPDGLYTAPTDEALCFDIQKTKEFGYNMIRKHVKVEPARWYYHCDRLGVLVWQDMPSGDQRSRQPQWQNRNYFNGSEFIRSAESEANYRKEWKEIIDFLISNPSIVVWIPFNEAWGQFKCVEIAEWTKSYDPSRLVNPASGGNHYRTGDMLTIHNYPNPEMYLYDAERATVLGEYGGIGLPLENHLWLPDRNWGYIQFKDAKEVTDEYIKYAEMLKTMISTGFSAAVYTQTTDVEIEVNGIMTYDRKVDKLEVDRLKKINQEVINMLK